MAGKMVFILCAQKFNIARRALRDFQIVSEQLSGAVGLVAGAGYFRPKDLGIKIQVGARSDADESLQRKAAALSQPKCRISVPLRFRFPLRGSGRL